MSLPQRLKLWLPSLVSGVLLVASLWFLRQEIKSYSLKELQQSLNAISWQHVGWAIAFTLSNCLVFAGYDAVALRYIGHRLPYLKTALAAVTSTAISNTVGLGLLSSSAIRYRFYGTWGLSALQITKVIAFVSLSFWLGLFTASSVLFVGQPIVIPTILHLPFTTTRPIGILFLGVVIVYLIWNGISSRALHIQSLTIPHIPLRFCLAQLTVASLDWILAASTLYILLPKSVNLSYELFFGVYLLAQFAGIVSNVPGGLGVFETVILLLLSHHIFSAKLLGSLFVYRIVYYLLPLIIAILLLGSYEFYHWRQSNNRSVL